MAGQQFFDVLAQATTGTKGPTNVTRIAADTNGALLQSIKGAAYTPLGGGSFGSDTIVLLPNVALTQVKALEVATSLTNNGVGTEASQWIVSLLSAGAQVTALDIQPTHLRVPAGATTQPSLAFQGTTNANKTGFYYDSGTPGIGMCINGALVATLSTVSLNLAGGLSQFSIVDGGFRRIGPNGDQQIFTLHDVVIGSSAALATNATAGFLQIPTCAGTPTGTVAAITGKACLVYDTTNFKLALSTGGGTWKQTAALT